MIDPRVLRDPTQVALLRQRASEHLVDAALNADRRRRDAITQVEQLQAKVRKVSQTVREAKQRGDEAAARHAMQTSARLGLDVRELETEVRLQTANFDHAFNYLPNIAAPDVPEGDGETQNVEIRTWGEKPIYTFPPRPHDELGAEVGIDPEAGARLAGSRFTVLRGAAATVERKLGQFMMNMHVDKHGYQEIAPPLMVKREAMFGTGQLPKFEDDLFRAGDHFLIPTAEVPLTNLAAGEIMPEDRSRHSRSYPSASVQQGRACHDHYSGASRR